ncbi:ROK family protein [Rhizomicrobium electricum]|uniref:fructokinase n=2 Tax=Rhizomicrobium electricum TaxID=480070 RepID=A0ABN1ET95_9PROT
MVMQGPLFGTIEAGGTKFVCALGRDPHEMRRCSRIPTTTPEETLGRAVKFFRDAERDIGQCAAYGIACFGPAAVDPSSPQWGSILATPKPGWSNVNVAGAIAEAFGKPVGFDTDVNGAALAEFRWGAAQGADAVVYITVGTGLGAGFVIDGRPLHGARHPEVGHILPRKHPKDLTFPGVCPFHGDCFEGVACGLAIAKRWGKPLSELPQDHEAHAIIGWYLGQLASALTATYSPRKIIFGGGVMKTPGLLDGIRKSAVALTRGYFADDETLMASIEAPGLGDNSGLAGGLALAEHAWLLAGK